MSPRIVAVACVLTVAGVALSVLVPPVSGVPALAAAAWLFYVERAIGVGRFVRFDPRRPVERRARRRRDATLYAMAGAAVAASLYGSMRYPEPLLLIGALYAFLALYTVWAVGYIRSYDEEQVIEVRVRDAA